MRKRRLIFLDIDGVMNSNRYYTSMKAEEVWARHDEYGDGFDETSAKFMNMLIDESGADVVISSTWKGQGLDKMRAMWKKRGMSGNVVGITPDIVLRRNYDVSVPRGLEIKEYYQTVHKFRHRTYDAPFLDEMRKESDLESYVIIDDDQDMLYEQRHNFVWCDPLEGFGEKEYRCAVGILVPKDTTGTVKCPCDDPETSNEPWCFGCYLKSGCCREK